MRSHRSGPPGPDGLVRGEADAAQDVGCLAPDVPLQDVLLKENPREILQIVSCDFFEGRFVSLSSGGNFRPQEQRFHDIGRSLQSIEFVGC